MNRRPDNLLRYLRQYTPTARLIVAEALNRLRLDGYDVPDIRDMLKDLGRLDRKEEKYDNRIR